jgi:6-phosphogluconolactonase
VTLLYVGSYTAERDGAGVGIEVFARDGSRLEKLAELATPSPSYLIADGDRLYAVNETDQGSVSSYAIEPGAAVRALSTRSTGGGHPCHLALVDGHLLAANYTSGDVSVHPVAADGTLGERTDLARRADLAVGPRADRQQGPHAHQVLAAPDGLVTVIDLGVDRLLHYRLDGGQLTVAGETVVPAGCGPRHAAIHPSGRWYVAGELDSTVLTLTPADGVLSTVPASSYLGVNHPSAIVLSADGRHVYVGNRGPNTIATFAVADDGALAPLGELDCGGEWPRDIAVVDDVLFVANHHSHTVVAFRLDAATGVPYPTGDVLEIGSPSCVLALG